MAGSFLKGQLVNNSESTLKRLWSLYRNSTLSDVQLVVGGAVFSAHKLILSMCSDVFKTMLTDFKWPEAFKEQITLTEEPECVDVFEDFLEYMYTGHIHLSNHTVLPVITLADKYNVKDLSETCVSYMCDNLDAVGDNLQVVSWLQYARLCNYRTLEAKCAQYTEWNFQKVVQGRDFLSMNGSTLFEFLSSSELVVHSEYSLFLHLKRWLLSNQAHCRKCPRARRVMVEKMAGCVRFNMMTSAQLELLCQDNFIHEYADIFEEGLMQAFQYHSITAVEYFTKLDEKDGGMSSASPDSNSSDPEKVVTSCQPSSRPRNYTCEDWSCQFTLENFSCLDDFTTRTFFFSTPVSSSAADDHACWDWQVDLYPKGVRFPKAIMIGILENYEIDQHEHHITRLGVMAKSVHGEIRNVEVSILALASGINGSEYIRNVVKKQCIFDFDGCLHNLDDIVPFDELMAAGSVYLTEEDRNTFKILIIIKPVR
ncbi:BTB/POZ domain-containing protein 17-like [Haliotis rufescens]|uniref:BTB/POZ domain-containing protein 17-like n=1 Tax=Haliotis rufescens TaxID=6454 RepID=UPI001EAFD6A7|nr:BTB/POZ domain-containing protein 17-like [Haliotis rufescens]